MPRKKASAQISVEGEQVPKAHKIPLVSLGEARQYTIERDREQARARKSYEMADANDAIGADSDARASVREPVRMLDGDFGARIEMVHQPGIKHRNEIYPDGHLSIGIIGYSGSGKSYLLLSILPQIAALTQVIICSRVHTPVYDQIRRWCASQRESSKDDAPAITFAKYTTPQEADVGISEMTRVKKKDTFGIIIFDDFSSGTTSHGDAYMKIQNTCTMQKRNDGYHSCIITQQYTNIGTKSRNNTNMLFAFNMRDKYAIDGFVRHCYEATGYNPQDIREAYHDYTEKPHSYMLLVNYGGRGTLFAKPDADKPIVEIEMADTTADIDDIINDTHLLSLIDTRQRLEERRRAPNAPKNLMRETNRVRDNIRRYIDLLATENNISSNDISRALFERGIDI